jgi:negative regulator of flagellin synthesis FlgM
MKINSSTDPVRLDTGSSVKSGKTAATDKQATSADVSISGVATKLNSLETQFSSDSAFDAGKVESVKEAIREGRFTVNAEVVADRLIASAQELIAKKSS